MFCKNCGETMNDNQAICLKCGVKTGEGNAFCANCGNPVSADAAVCLNCGVAIKKSGAEGDLGGKDKVTMALICFFLGGLGIHNFMMGETKKGVVKIILSLCCGIGGILALIDFIKILLDKYVVDPTKAF
ncbi:MAG: NINE protein [Ruminococcaceae bacterium]|nr:NINE protein [Oscillospiraceae bacterium]